MGFAEPDVFVHPDVHGQSAPIRLRQRSTKGRRSQRTDAWRLRVDHEASNNVVSTAEHGTVGCVQQTNLKPLATRFIGHGEGHGEGSVEGGGVGGLHAKGSLNVKRLEHRPTGTCPREGRPYVEFCFRPDLGLSVGQWGTVKIDINVGQIKR